MSTGDAYRDWVARNYERRYATRDAWRERNPERYRELARAATARYRERKLAEEGLRRCLECRTAWPLESFEPETNPCCNACEVERPPRQKAPGCECRSVSDFRRNHPARARWLDERRRATPEWKAYMRAYRERRKAA